jgi:Uma2 family endonuclease
MTTAQLVSVEEYLHSTFEHDAEYVEGKILPRSLPQRPHSKLQTWFARTLFEAAHPFGYEVWVEQRVRTQYEPRRYRVPDVCLTMGDPLEDVFTSPPFLCIEILSPQDSAVELRTKVDEYLAFGVLYIWVIDPVSKAGEIYCGGRIEKITNAQFNAGEIHIDLSRFD